MQKITLNIKDDNKVNFLMELLQQFDFIEIQTSSQKRKTVITFLLQQGCGKTGILMQIS